ncbi:hypothetical protein ACOMHN_035060 [Nucella lapillus]
MGLGGVTGTWLPAAEIDGPAMGEGDRRLLGPGHGLGSGACSVLMVRVFAVISLFVITSLPRAPTRAAAARLPKTVAALVMALLSNHKLQLSHLRADQQPEPEPEVAEQEAKEVFPPWVCCATRNTCH